MSKSYLIYILASEARELYIGLTNNLLRRAWEHRTGLDPQSYSSLHGTTRLVYFEMTPNVSSAIRREKQLKRFHRREKLQLIEEMNPEWRDLAEIYFRSDAPPPRLTP
jgi:putative endonuclease